MTASRVMKRLLLPMLVLVAVLAPGSAWANDADVQTAWRLLDYVGVDYAGAVADGHVISTAEYAEMQEFAASIQSRIAALPQTPEQPSLVTAAAHLQSAIAAKADPGTVRSQADMLADSLLSAYPVPLAPSRTPNLARGAQLYRENCAGCHGTSGNGQGPNAAQLDPPPIAFSDRARARQRSLFGLYQVIGQGIDGTAMPSFTQLSSDDRWALAFHAGAFAYPAGLADRGMQIWRSDPAIRARFPDAAALTRATPAALAAAIGAEKAQAITAFLRRNPQAVTSAGPASLSVARDKLAQAVAAYRKGDRRSAKELALSAYLDGFEPVEPLLTARDGPLMARIEEAMGGFRAAIDDGASADMVERQAQVIGSLLTDAEAALSPDRASAASAFLGAFTILLREGLEALLIVVAMIAFLRKADRGKVVRHVHAGWVAALAAGVATWAAATYLIGISGASRELTEGFGSIFAAIVLLSVGIWMHGKSRADQWQRYIRDKLDKALSARSAWFLFLLAFVVVYREVFETILFYAALWTQGNGGAILAGAGTAMIVLGVIGWTMLRYSRKLPIAQFFAYSSALIAVLAVVLAGKGVAALQEAGIIDIAPLANVPRIAILGIFPSIQVVVAQLLAVAVIAIGFWLNGRRSRETIAAE
jgi:high-affinity iron transporter